MIKVESENKLCIIEGELSIIGEELGSLILTFNKLFDKMDKESKDFLTAMFVCDEDVYKEYCKFFITMNHAHAYVEDIVNNAKE